MDTAQFTVTKYGKLRDVDSATFTSGSMGYLDTATGKYRGDGPLRVVGTVPAGANPDERYVTLTGRSAFGNGVPITYNGTAFTSVYGTAVATWYLGGIGGDYGQGYVFDSQNTGLNSIAGFEFGDTTGARNCTFGPLTSNTFDSMWGSRGGLSFHTGASPSPHHGQNNVARGYIDTLGRWAIGGAIVNSDLSAGDYPNARLLVSNQFTYSQDPSTGLNTQVDTSAWVVLALRGYISQTGAYLRLESSTGSLRFQITSGFQFEWANPSNGTVDTVLRRDATGSLRTDTRFQVGTNLTVLAGTAAITTTLSAAYSATSANSGDVVVKCARNTAGGMVGIEFVDSTSTRRGSILWNMQSSGMDLVFQGFNGSAYQEIGRFTRLGLLQLGGTTGPTLGFVIGTGTYWASNHPIRMTVATAAPVTADMANNTAMIYGNGTTQVSIAYKGNDGTLRTGPIATVS